MKKRALRRAAKDLTVIRKARDVSGGTVNTTRFDPYKNFKF